MFYEFVICGVLRWVIKPIRSAISLNSFLKKIFALQTICNNDMAKLRFIVAVCNHKCIMKRQSN